MNRKDDGTIILSLTISWKKIEAGYEKEIAKIVDNAELPGFRKGKAPRKDVEAKLNKAEIYGEAVREILPEEYEKLIKEHDLKPVMYPRVEIKKAEVGQDWEFEISTCEAPKIDLPKDSKGKTPEDLVKTVEVIIPQMLAEEEANYRLGALSENLTKVGLNFDTFLQSKKMTVEDYKAQTITEAKNDLKLRFLSDSLKALV